VNIIQHPNGEPKQLAIRNNQVVDELELFLHYRTDTDPGSSGSPVFNDQWEVVALHHSGVPKRNEQGQVVTSDGRLWQEWMGEQRIAWEANEGVRVSRLVRHIRNQPLPAAAEAMRQKLLAATPPMRPRQSGPVTLPPVFAKQHEPELQQGEVANPLAAGVTANWKPPAGKRQLRYSHPRCQCPGGPIGSDRSNLSPCPRTTTRNCRGGLGAIRTPWNAGSGSTHACRFQAQLPFQSSVQLACCPFAGPG